MDVAPPVPESTLYRCLVLLKAWVINIVPDGPRSSGNVTHPLCTNLSLIEN